ncbi:hypothetical protein B0H14DRAFT_2616624 [Mycena olivaceomarginata]|nr:hypothetical protein B0H14DRAFT_2616624 [Mycena olivaceomarginata]
MLPSRFVLRNGGWARDSATCATATISWYKTAGQHSKVTAEGSSSMMSGTQMDKRKTTTRTKAKSTQPQKKVVDERPEGWLWHLGRLSKMSDTEMDEWSNEGDRVQWFRAEAEMQRWQEQGEQKLAELLRTNRSFLKMEDTWTALASQNAQTKPGHSAYAKQKATMYHKHAEMAQALILGVGYGDLLASDASLVQRVQEERDAERKFLTRLSFASVEAFVQQAFSLLPILGLVRITMSETVRHLWVFWPSFMNAETDDRNQGVVEHRRLALDRTYFIALTSDMRVISGQRIIAETLKCTEIDVWLGARIRIVFGRVFPKRNITPANDRRVSVFVGVLHRIYG